MKARRLLTIAAAALLLSGCNAGSFGVGVQRLMSDIVFGLEGKHQPKPPQQPALPPPPALPGFGSYSYPPDNTQASCPSAAPGTPADKVATSNITGVAQDGTYKWYSTYTRRSGSSSTETSGFERRYVENAQQLPDDPSSNAGVPDHTYTWLVMQPDPFQDGYVDQMTFVAHTYSNEDNVPESNNPDQSVPVLGNWDPAAGIDLTLLQRFKAGNPKPVETYQPASPGLLIFTLPVPTAAGGASTPVGNAALPPSDPSGSNNYGWQFTANDAAHQWSEQITAFEGNQRKTIDACGTIINAWPVSADLSINKIDPATGTPYTSPLKLHWDYFVAPQYGGLVVKQRLTGDGGYGSTVDTLETIGSLTILPLPKKGSG